jgi:hypothetical protein
MSGKPFSNGFDSRRVPGGKPWKPGTTSHRLKLLDSVVFVDNSEHLQAAKDRFREELPEVCTICGLTGMWNGQVLVMRIDHINGRKRDCRRENMRKVCPNCDSQLLTFCGRNTGKVRARMAKLADAAVLKTVEKS